MSDFQEKIEQLFPDETVTVKDYRSFINQPERIQITSQQDVNDYDPDRLTTYFNFRVPLQRPALNVKSIQLARASIPNAVPSFPDTECVFWYYALPWVTTNLGEIRLNAAGAPGNIAYRFDSSGNLYTPVGDLFTNSEVHYDGSANIVEDNATFKGWINIAGTLYTYNYAAARDSYIANPPTSASYVEVYTADTNILSYWLAYDVAKIADPKINYLRYVRLLPSYSIFNVINYSVGATLAYNRVFDDYADLLSELQIAQGNDMLFDEDQNGGLGEFKFVADLIRFEFYPDKKKFAIYNETWDGEETTTQFTLQPATTEDANWKIASQILANRDSAYFIDRNFDVPASPQPFTALRNMNLRLGFTFPTLSAYIQDFKATLCPWPNIFGVSPPGLGDQWEDDILRLFAPGYPDLVHTACVHLYTDITGGATYDTIANRNYLGAVPMNTPTLGVGYHSLPLNNPLTKIPTQINEIYIEMRNDNGDPFYLGNNAIVSCEFILTYN